MFPEQLLLNPGGAGVSRPKVFIVENDRALALEIREKLESMGFEVLENICANIRDGPSSEPQKIQESEERFRALVETTSDWVWEVDPHGRYTYSSPKVRDILGYEPKEIIGTMILEHVSPDEVEGVSEIIGKVLMSQGPIEQLEKKVLHKDGKIVILETSGVPFYDATGVLMGYRGMNRDVTERTHVEEQLRASLLEKEILLKEVHHRVKNNMQIISSMLSLQSRYIRDRKFLQMFDDSRNRIHSMAMVHEKLYRSKDLSRIEFSEYIKEFTRFLYYSYKKDYTDIKLIIAVNDLYLDVNKAIPCGLIINELMSNSLKYAFPEEKKGEIHIAFSRESDGYYSLSICDNGIGIPGDVDIENTETLGLKLVNALTRQLHGEMILNRTEGTEFLLRFPEEYQSPNSPKTPGGGLGG